MIGSLNSGRAWVVGIMLLAGLLVTSAGAAFAQDEATVPASHPAHIHEGTCDDLNPNPLAPLSNVAPRTADDEEETDENGNDEQEMRGALDANQVYFSETYEIDMSLDALLHSSHAINVHESDENIQNYIACGSIGGVVVDDQVIIGLHEENGSGYVGVAMITDVGDDQVDVWLFLAQGLAETAEPTPVDEGTPEP